MLSELIHSFSAIPIKIPEIFFVDIDTIILKFIWKDRGTRIAKTILRKKNNVERISLISRHHVVTVKTGCYWPSDRSVE